MFSLALANSWVVYKVIGGKDLLVTFTLSVAGSLIFGSVQAISDERDDDQPKSKSLKRLRVPTDIRHDKVNLWSVHVDLPNSQSCKATNCTCKKTFQCFEC